MGENENQTGTYRLIGVSGYAGSGKDEATNGLGWHRIEMSCDVKNACEAIDPWIYVGNWNEEYAKLTDLIEEHGWDYCKRTWNEVRELMQRVGTEAGRDIHGDDCWIRRMAHRLDKERIKELPLAVTGVRFSNEFELIRNHGGIIINVKRDGVGGGKHRSESVDIETDWDVRIHNNSTIEDLHDAMRYAVCRDKIEGKLEFREGTTSLLK